MDEWKEGGWAEGQMLTRGEASLDGEMEDRKERQMGGLVVGECGSKAGCLQWAGRKGRQRRNEQTNDRRKVPERKLYEKERRMDRGLARKDGKEVWNVSWKGRMRRQEERLSG